MFTVQAEKPFQLRDILWMCISLICNSLYMDNLMFRCSCLRKALRKRTSWSRNERLSWPRSWDCSQGKWLCGSRTVGPVGKLSNSKGIMIFSSHPTMPSSQSTIALSRTMKISNQRYISTVSQGPYCSRVTILRKITNVSVNRININHY